MRQFLFRIAKTVQENSVGTLIVIVEVLGGDSLGRMHGGVPESGAILAADCGCVQQYLAHTARIAD